MRDEYELFTKPPVTGVGGWLLFLCYALTVFSPLNWIRESVASYHVFKRVVPVYPLFGPRYALITLITLLTLITGAVMLFGLYAGVQLWRERRGAVTLARRFLVLVPLVPLAGPIPYAFLPGVPVNLKAVAEGFLFTLFWAVLWYSYLRRSVRVENTFPEAFPAPVRPPASSPPPTG
jgi:hypothetical protein